METGSCPELLALSAFLDEGLHEREDEEIKLHIQNCPECKKQIKRLDVADDLIRRHLAEPMTLSDRPRKPDCITPELMTAYLHDLLPVNEKRTVDRHIEECDACLSELDSVMKTTIRLGQSRTEPLPDVLRKRVEGLWAKGQKDKEPILRLVVRLATDGLEVLRDTLIPKAVVVQDMFAPVGAYRSGERSSLPSGVLLKQNLSGIQLSVLLEWQTENRAGLKIRTEDENLQPLSGHRVLLRRDEVLVCSERTGTDGTVVIADIEAGSYSLGTHILGKEFSVDLEINKN